MPVTELSEITRLGTDESHQMTKVCGIVTDEGKRTFSLYHV